VLPLLNRHYHAISQRWEIGGLGISQLFQPTQRLTAEVRSVSGWVAARPTTRPPWAAFESSACQPPACRLPSAYMHT